MRSHYKPTPLNLCARCLHRRLCSTSSVNSSQLQLQLPRSVPPSGACRLTNRALLSLHGSDAVPFLQGLISANLQPQRPSGFYTAFLNAQGRVLHDVFIYPFSRYHILLQDLGTINKDKQWDPKDEGFFIECDAHEIKTLEKHLKKHKLRSKVQIRALDRGEWDIWSVWKKDEIWTQYHELSGTGAEASTEENPFVCVDARAPGMGRRILVPHKSDGFRPPVTAKNGVEEFGIEAYKIRRMLRGVAEGQGEIVRETALPLESNIDFMGGIDFRKGCYLGQELTIRTHHTGVVRKRILPVQIYGPDEEVPQGWQPKREKPTYDSGKGDKMDLPPAGTNISRVGKKGRSTGKWLGGIGNIGLALCRLEMMTDVIITGEGSMYQADEQFQVAFGSGEEDIKEESSNESRQQEQQVRIKAFVPDWIRNRIVEKEIRK
jgi:folate-binding protein YgfZ